MERHHLLIQLQQLAAVTAAAAVQAILVVLAAAVGIAALVALELLVKGLLVAMAQQGLYFAGVVFLEFIMLVGVGAAHLKLEPLGPTTLVQAVMAVMETLG
jgi:hypothetical protein